MELQNLFMSIKFKKIRKSRNYFKKKKKNKRMHAKREYGNKKFINTEFYFLRDEILENIIILVEKSLKTQFKACKFKQK